MSFQTAPLLKILTNNFNLTSSNFLNEYESQLGVSTIAPSTITLSTHTLRTKLTTTTQRTTISSNIATLATNLDSLIFYDNKYMTEEEFFNSLPVSNIFPLSATATDKSVLVYSMLYSVLFLVGICGIVAIITVIRHSNIYYDNTLIYVLFLCCVDLISIMPLPFAIIDQLLGFWMFGSLMCKLYRLWEHLGRALSPFILVLIAFDRYFRVCYPYKKTRRKVIFVQMIILSTFSFLLFLPLIYKSSSEEFIINEVLLENPYRLTRVRIFKCIDQLDGTPFAIFIIYTFIIGFFVPCILIIVFYALMLKKQLCSQPSFKFGANGIEYYTIAITVFYVICWTPYWMVLIYLNVYKSYSEMEPEKENTNVAEETSTTSKEFIYLMYFVHSLPYFNAALNCHLIRVSTTSNNNFSYSNERRDQIQHPNTSINTMLHNPTNVGAHNQIHNNANNTQTTIYAQSSLTSLAYISNTSPNGSPSKYGCQNSSTISISLKCSGSHKFNDKKIAFDTPPVGGRRRLKSGESFKTENDQMVLNVMDENISFFENVDVFKRNSLASSTILPRITDSLL